MNLESRLLSLGLTEKEVAVYLSMLYLGPATAQEIALRAAVNRATTYVMIDALLDRSMVSQVTKDKKTLFQAEDPIQLLKVLEKNREDVEEKMGQARLIIPDLQELYNLNRSRLSVRILEGRESAKIIQNDLARSKSKTLDTITNLTLATEKFPVSEDDHRRMFYKQNFRVRSIFTYDPAKPVPQLAFLDREDRRLISQEKFPMFGEILLYDNKMCIINLEEKIFGIIIEDKHIYQTYSAIFNLAWDAAEKYSIKESKG